MKAKNKNGWFEINRSGFKKVQLGKDKTYIVNELVSNSFDEDGDCKLYIEETKVKNIYQFIVEDNTEGGFEKLSDAYTLYSDSYKKSNSGQRGRFGLGTKNTLAIFDEAKIISTKGSVIFHKDGTRTKSNTKTASGSKFVGKLKMTKGEYNAMIKHSRLIIPPKEVTFHVNGNEIKRGNTVSAFTINQLPTVICDDEGNLTKSKRNAVVELFAINSDDQDQKNYICELGVPVVEIDLPYTVNVQQRIPLNKDRDNITPKYRETIYTAVLNNVHEQLSDEELTDTWVDLAVSNPDIEKDAFKEVFDSRYGEDAVTRSLDQEANMEAQSHGMEVVDMNKSMSSGTRDNIRRFRNEFDNDGVDFLQSSHQTGGGIFASPSFVGGATEIEEEELSSYALIVGGLAKVIHEDILKFGNLNVVFHDGKGALATYGSTNGDGMPYCKISFFYNELGKDFFVIDSEDKLRRIIELLIHEFAHYYSSNHLSSEYHKGLSKIGAKLTVSLSTRVARSLYESLEGVGQELYLNPKLEGQSYTLAYMRDLVATHMHLEKH